MSTKGNWQKTLLEICSSNLGCLIGPFGWRQVVGSLFSLKMSLKKTSQPQCCWQNWGWTLCSPLDELLSLCKQECGIKMFGKRVNGKLCVCVNLMRAFPSANASYGCIQCLFNAKSVFAIVWIDIFPFLLPKCFSKYFVLVFFFFLQWTRIRLNTIRTFTQTYYFAYIKNRSNHTESWFLTKCSL